MRTPGTCLILGSGMGGLALGALLARAGVAVTVLEAHPTSIGGWAQTVTIGGYHFAAGPRYLWNFGPGQIGRRFLEKCELSERVPMVELDRRGFDHVYVGDDEPVRVPNGWTEYEDVLKARFPVEAPAIERFFALGRRVFRVFEIIDEEGLYLEPWRTVLWRCGVRRPTSILWVLRHRWFTLEQAFDRCGLGQRLRTVLAAHGGLFVLPPAALSFHAYVAGTLFYHRGCYYPLNDMEGFIGALVDTIEQRGGQVLRNQRVVSATASRRGVMSVTTHTSDRFSADVVVVNFDPRTFLAMLHPSGELGHLRLPEYRYSPSVYSLFLGVNDRQILERRFGRWNIWYCGQPGAAAPSASDLLYLNSPTLVKGTTNDAPAGHATVTAFAPCSDPALRELAPAARQDKTVELIELIDRRFAPGLKQHVAVSCLRTPADKERILLAPGGTIYGRSFEPREVWTKVPFKGLLPNLYLVGSYVSFAGIASVIHGASRVYEELTGDRV